MKSITTEKRWFRVFWDLFDDDNISYEDAFFLSYLIEIYPILKQSETIDGIKCKRLSDSFIQEKIPISNRKINTILDNLVENEYIVVKKINNKKKGIRYYALSKQLNNCLKIIDEDVINESEDISFVEEEKNSTEPVNEIKYVPQAPIFLKRENHYSSRDNVF